MLNDSPRGSNTVSDSTPEQTTEEQTTEEQTNEQQTNDSPRGSNTESEQQTNDSPRGSTHQRFNAVANTVSEQINNYPLILSDVDEYEFDYESDFVE